MQAKGPLMSLRRPSKRLSDIKNLLKGYHAVPKSTIMVVSRPPSLALAVLGAPWPPVGLVPQGM